VAINLDESVEFAINPEPRCPCVLLLDTSGSMTGKPIDALNAGLKSFRDSLMKDSLASKRVEIAIVTFESSVTVVQDFVTMDHFSPPVLSTGVLTCMGEGIVKALDLLQERKQRYRKNGVDYYRPWVFMITDGGPTDGPEIIAQATKRIHAEEGSKGVAFFAVGVQGADMGRLQQIAVRAPLMLDGLDFQSMFIWLSRSMQSISQTKLGEQTALAPPGWSKV
jgi:uncharacterized protein YegL